MVKKKELIELPPIPINEIELGGVYRAAVNDLVKVEKIDAGNKKVVLYNITGAHKQWVDFRYLHLVEKVYQSR